MKNVNMCYKGKFDKRRQTEDNHLNFHLHITLAHLKVYTKFHNPKSSSC